MRLATAQNTRLGCPSWEILSYFKSHLSHDRFGFDSNSNSAEISHPLINLPRGPVGYKDSTDSYMKIAIRGSGNAVTIVIERLSGRTTRR